jgi:hypothetical protein
MRNRALASLFVTLVFSCLAFSQTLERGDINGTVYDPAHAVIPQAKVSLLSPATGYQRTVETDAAGQFHFPQVPPGQYSLTGESANFSPTKIENIDLHIGGNLIIDLNMSVKGTSEEVNVEAAAVDVGTQGVSQLINSESVSNLPLAGRDYRDLAQLTPSAQVVPGLRGGIRLGGQQSDYTGLSIDGGDATNNYYGEFFGSLETKNFTIPQDAVQEFQVVTNGFAPEFGHSTGGLLNVVTKSGTNDVHGTAHYYFRSHSLTANDALGFAPNVDSQHQFGGSIGFPLVKDKQFLFLAVEGQREHGPLVTKFARDVSGVTLGAPYNIPMSSLEGSHNQFQNLFSLLGHYDWQVNQANHFSVRAFFTRNDTNGFTGGQGQNETVVSFDNTEHFQNQGPNAVFTLNTVLSSTKVNEAKLELAYETRKRHSNSDLPQVLINDTGTFGQRFYLPSNGDNGKLQAQDNFDYVFGKHDIKFGGEVDRFLDNKDTFAGWSKGEYLYATLEDFEAHTPYEFIQGFGLNGQDIFTANRLKANYQTDIGLYWQDKWQVTPKLTLTYGLRWDGTRNPQPQSRIPGAQVYVGDGPIGAGGSHLAAVPQKVPNDYEQWGPRVGVSYAMGSHEHPTVIRGAWGLYYAVTPLIFFPTLGGSRAGTLFCVPFPGFDCLPPASPNSIVPLFPSSLPISVDQLCTYTVVLIGCPSNFYADPSFRNPRVSNFTTGVEQSFGSGWVFNATYAFQHSTRLRTGGFSTTVWSRNVVVDHVDQFGRSIVVPFTAIDPTVSFFGNTELGSFSHGNYHEVVVGLKKTISKIQFFGSYTFSRNADNASTERDTDSFFGPQDPFNLNLDYGRNGLDVTHQFKSAVVASLPHGFTLSDSIIVHSGLAYPAYDALDANNDSVINQFAFNDRPTVTPAGGQPFLLQRFPARQPGFFETDLRIGKTFKLSERYELEALADLFNLTNRGNLFSDPNVSAFVPDQLTSIPKPGQQFSIPVVIGGAPTGNFSNSTYRTPDQIAPGSLPFAAQFGVRLSF